MMTLETAFFPTVDAPLLPPQAGHERPNVLLVDDEPLVLDALARVLRRHFRVVTASGGSEGLAEMATTKFAAVISDMRMPDMDGAAFLAHARELDPDVVRLLLTGEADLSAAASAVNLGEIFRFLRKPCTPAILESELNAAVERHRALVAERHLLELTLSGSVKVLTDVLALACPVAFSRAVRVKRVVSGVADVMGTADRWQLELAAMLSQLGAISVNPDILERAYRGEVLDVPEERAIAEMSHVTDQLVGNIPRLEPVREILRLQDKHADWSEPLQRVPRSPSLTMRAHILRVALAYDVLESAGNSPTTCLSVMRARDNIYNSAVLDALHTWLHPKDVAGDVRELRLADVRVGMIFTRDVQSENGLVLIGRGQEVTPSMMQRIRNSWLHVPLKQLPLVRVPV